MILIVERFAGPVRAKPGLDVSLWPPFNPVAGNSPPACPVGQIAPIPCFARRDYLMNEGVA